MIFLLPLLYEYDLLNERLHETGFNMSGGHTGLSRTYCPLLVQPEQESGSRTWVHGRMVM